MTRNEAAEMLISKRSGIYKRYNLRHDKPYDALVKAGFSVEEDHMYLLTAATPLALLTPTQLDCAEWLIDERQAAFRDAEPLQRKQMEILVKKGLANEEMWSWKPTPKLIEAVECWRKAKEGLK